MLAKEFFLDQVDVRMIALPGVKTLMDGIVDTEDNTETQGKPVSLSVIQHILHQRSAGFNGLIQPCL